MIGRSGSGGNRKRRGWWMSICSSAATSASDATARNKVGAMVWHGGAGVESGCSEAIDGAGRRHRGRTCGEARWRGGGSKSGAGRKKGMLELAAASMGFANGQARRTSIEQMVPADTSRTHRPHGTLLTSLTRTTTRSSRNPWRLERFWLPGLVASQAPLPL